MRLTQREQILILMARFPDHQTFRFRELISALEIQKRSLTVALNTMIENEEVKRHFQKNKPVWQLTQLGRTRGQDLLTEMALEPEPEPSTPPEHVRAVLRRPEVQRSDGSVYKMPWSLVADWEAEAEKKKALPKSPPPLKYMPSHYPTERAACEDEEYADKNCHIRYLAADRDLRTWWFFQAYRKELALNRCDEQLRRTEPYARSRRAFWRYRNNYARFNTARLKADLHSARYDFYLQGVFVFSVSEFHEKADCRWGRSYIPVPPQNLASENSQNYYRCTKDSFRETRRTITRGDLEDSGLGWILPENFDGNRSHPEIYAEQCRLLESQIYPDVERMWFHYRADDESMNRQVSKAIHEGILPRAWVQGYGRHHLIRDLERFVFIEETPHWSKRCS